MLGFLRRQVLPPSLDEALVSPKVDCGVRKAVDYGHTISFPERQRPFLAHYMCEGLAKTKLVSRAGSWFECLNLKSAVQGLAIQASTRRWRSVPI